MENKSCCVYSDDVGWRENICRCKIVRLLSALQLGDWQLKSECMICYDK